MTKCALTGKTLSSPLYHSQSDRSITSLSQICSGATVVYLNREIGHLQTKEVDNVGVYYDKLYQFFNQSEEDDILYEVVNGEKIFRQQHQVDTLLSKISFKPGMKILDYGCAKGTVMKRLSSQNPTLIPYLFDVSKMYVHLWEKFVLSDQYASYHPKKEWKESFDVITSFFAFEHTPDPVKEILTIKHLLKPNGIFYCVVPNVFENPGDFIVADHIHHYSEFSLRYMFAKAGFQTLQVDSQSHFSAFIIIGKKTNRDSIPYKIPERNLLKINQDFINMANYWENLQLNIRNFEKDTGDEASAIYGAGVYGNFIATCIQNLDNVKCFIDQNQLLEGQEIMGKPILNPKELPLEVANLYVGLNPKIARKNIDDIESWKQRTHKYLFL